ncbi:MAG: hypothetical protein FWB74_05695, partial [Defluviitaleaceae bacterium]|nr:hypothetical protein [Defluviitaleaceae bacterium]
MSNYFGSSKKQYSLDIANPLNSTGGEGIIYNVNGSPNLVAKLYRPNKVTASREKKLLHMVSHPPSQEAVDNIAWPQDVLYTGSGQFAGFIMRKLTIGEDLNVMYEYGAGAKYPMPLSHKITIAMNLCWVLEHVHSAGANRGDIVVGDFNPKNISVAPIGNKAGFITFLDTDSYHIGNGQYRCEVAMPEYIPQEIQKKMRGGGNLATATLPTFSLETDNFALAIHIFQLLMNGTHPFTCRIPKPTASVVAPQPIDNIENGVFPFLNPERGTDIPKFAPPISILTNELQSLFRRAFVDGHKNPGLRPKPAEFFKALEGMKTKLSRCGKDKNHEYLNTLSKCPWCQVDENMAPKRPVMPAGGQIPLGGGAVVRPPTQPWQTPLARQRRRQRRRRFVLAVLIIIVIGILGLIAMEELFDIDIFFEPPPAIYTPTLPQPQTVTPALTPSPTAPETVTTA